MAPDVSIIIVNYNSGDCLKQCIESIYAHTQNIDFEIIVVDNASTDSSFVNLCVQFVNLCGIKNQDNLGFSAANNIGAKTATGKYLFFLNPDTLLIDNSIHRFYEFLESAEPDIVSCGGLLIRPTGEPDTSFGNFPTLFQAFSDIGFRWLYRRYYDRHLSIAQSRAFDSPQPAGYLSGADIFIRREAFLNAGGFEEAYFMYYEDCDLFYRLNKSGYRAVILPDVKIVHHKSVSTATGGGFNYQKYALMEKSKYLYFGKNHGALSAKIAKLFQVIAVAVHSHRKNME